MTSRYTLALTKAGKFILLPASCQAMLEFIDAHPGAMYDEISEHLGIDVPTLTTYASRMANEHLLVRTPTKIDGRIRTTLTLAPGIKFGITAHSLKE